MQGNNLTALRIEQLIKLVMTESVLIILASYNGGTYIEQQIRSIQEQDYEKWSLWIRDDGSTDNTVALIRGISQNEKRIKLIEDDLGNLGPAANFSALMSLAVQDGTYDYVCFSDQDDVWMNCKLRLQLEKIKEMDETLPRLVFSDLELVDDTLQLIHKSAMAYRWNHNVVKDAIKVMAIENYITGCTIMTDMAMLKISTPVPQRAFMHDWWVALCAASAGQIGFVGTPLVKYRQHQSNVLGTSSGWGSMDFLLINRAERWKNNNQYFLQSVIQAYQLLSRICEDRVKKYADPKAKRFLIIYLSTFSQKSALLSVGTFVRCGVHRMGIMRNLTLWIRLPWILPFCKRNLPEDIRNNSIFSSSNN